MRRKLTTKEVVERFKKVHGEKYDYSLVEYVESHTNVLIVCPLPEHGEFPQTPSNHLRGSGCLKCSEQKGYFNKRKTKQDFIKQAKEVHADKNYSYEKVDYKNTHEKVIIICPLPEHGAFPQTPSNHLGGQGCPDCGRNSTREKQKSSDEEVIEKFKEVHGDKYDYSLVEYEQSNKKVLIVCPLPEHGEFTQTPSSHQQGRGCPDCGIIERANSKRTTKEDFIKQAKEVHSDKNYSYEKVDYKNTDEKVIIICLLPEHGAFPQTPQSHLQGYGCPKCGIIQGAENSKITFEEFIERSNLLHNNFYGYENVEYVDTKTVVKIICPEHGEFPQKPSKHLGGQGCPDCGIKKSADGKRKSPEEFIEEVNLIHGEIYNYDNVIYESFHEDVSITCPIHGDFPQSPANHLSGKGCPRCINKSEGRLAIILNEIGVVHRNHRISNRFFDFYLPEYNLIIERDGEQHYYDSFGRVKGLIVNFEEQQQIDIEKTNLAKSKGHKICRIPYWLSEEDEKKEIQNILNGQPTYPDVPDLEHEKSKPLPN